MEKKHPFFNMPKPSTDPNKIAISKVWCQLNDIQYQLGKKLNEADLKKFYIQLNELKNELNKFKGLNLKENDIKKVDRYLENACKLQNKITKKLNPETIIELDDTNCDNTHKEIEAKQLVEEKLAKENLTDAEKNAFDLIKNVVKDTVNPDDINYTKCDYYLQLNYKNDDNKWICRLFLDKTPYIIHVFDSENGHISFDFDSIDDLNDIKDFFINIVQNF
ncbi:hypothetical protein [Intestinibacter sp.]|uniref:hypothetical protein n=1 Tax=Intestinibacter sp. TaxID=1965304 RepID=UPI003F153334